MEAYALYILIAGLVIVAAGWLWLVIRAFRQGFWWGIGVLLFPPLGLLFIPMHWHRAALPFGVILLGGAVIAFPYVYNRLVPVDLGPHEKIVDGELHLGLNGWNRKDYSVLKSKQNAVVVQMANGDVTDETLEYLKGMSALRDLDLNNTRITDQGLRILKDLPRLEILRLANTAITDQGFREHLFDKESLRQVDLRGTQVTRETAQAWRKAGEKRGVMQ